MKSAKAKVLAGKPLVTAVVSQMVDMKAENIAAYRVQGMPDVCDWFVICSGNGTTHCRAVAGSIVDALKDKGCRPAYSEGIEDGRWAVLDYVDVVVHVMSPDMREYYDIEQLWRDGKRYDAGVFVKL